VANVSRDRVTIDLRGMGVRLHACAVARQVTAAALARRAIVTLLDGESVETAAHLRQAQGARPVRERMVKLTLRLPTTHVAVLVARARAADVSQGVYVAGLLDGSPLGPLPPDHRDAVAALARSSDHLATMSADVNDFMRLARAGKSDELERYRARVMSLTDDVRQHLIAASQLVAELKAARRPHGQHRHAPAKASWA